MYASCWGLEPWGDPGRGMRLRLLGGKAAIYRQAIDRLRKRRIPRPGSPQGSKRSLELSIIGNLARGEGKFSETPEGTGERAGLNDAPWIAFAKNIVMGAGPLEEGHTGDLGPHQQPIAGIANVALE